MVYTYSTYSCLGVLRALRKSLQLSESEIQSKLKLVMYKLVVYKLEIRIVKTQLNHNQVEVGLTTLWVF